MKSSMYDNAKKRLNDVESRKAILFRRTRQKVHFKSELGGHAVGIILRVFVKDFSRLSF